MLFDFLLPLTMFAISSVSLLLFLRYEKRLEDLSSGQKLRVRDAALVVVAMGVMIAVMVVMPERLMQIVFLFSASFILFLLTYLIVPKIPIAVLPSVLFVALYFLYWNLFLLDFFAILIVISAVLYVGRLFTWKTTLAFAALLTAMDIIHVFGTKQMAAVAEKTVGLGLPVMIIVPSFPTAGFIALGLGDLLLSGLFATQTAQRNGRRYGLICCASIAVTLLIGELVILNTPYTFLPATVFVTLGWLTSFLFTHLKTKGNEPTTQPKAS